MATTHWIRSHVALALVNRFFVVAVSASFGALSLSACSDDDEGEEQSEAQRTGVGASCVANEDCKQTPAALECLSFKGGYCGLTGCQTNADCPAGSACVTHDDGINYCFLVCTDKPECNVTRPADSEANCSSSILFVQPGNNVKACVPPSG
jgi:hypothetical protein